MIVARAVEARFQRRQILDYLRRTNEGRYKELIERLGIRR